MDESTDVRLVPGAEAAVLDDERLEHDEAYRVRFFDVLHRLAEYHGVQVVITRSAARWDSRYSPPRLLAATVRFARPGARARKRKRG